MVESYKYHGITLENKLNLIQHTKEMNKKIIKRTNLISRVLYKFSTRTTIIIWQSLVRSIIDYSKNISLSKNKQSKKIMETTYNMSLKKCL